MVGQDVIDTDAEQFDCETCPVACALDTLDQENAEAWAIYSRLCSRFAVDAGLIPDLLRHLVNGWRSMDVVDLYDRLGVIYDVMQPPKQAEG